MKSTCYPQKRKTKGWNGESRRRPTRIRELSDGPSPQGEKERVFLINDAGHSYCLFEEKLELDPHKEEKMLQNRAMSHAGNMEGTGHGNRAVGGRGLDKPRIRVAFQRDRTVRTEARPQRF